MLEYFHNRNKNATSSRGKRGSAIKISDIKRELKLSANLSQKQVQSNLTYLISQGWVEERSIEKSFSSPSGTVFPSTTSYYQITAAGIDKIEGPGEFTNPKFQGIKIEATGQNIITVGDGNQINSKFGEIGEALSQLRSIILGSPVSESEKMNLVADVDTIQSQLAKTDPNPSIIKSAWDTIKSSTDIFNKSVRDMLQKLLSIFL